MEDFLRGAHPIIVITEDGLERRFPSVNGAVVDLNISPTTIRRCAKTGTEIRTKLGLVTIKYEEQ